MLLLTAPPTENDEDCARFDALCEELSSRSVGEVLIAPHLYFLRPTHPAITRVVSEKSGLRVASFLHARATRWILGFFHHPNPNAVTAYDIRRYSDPASCAEQLAGDLGELGDANVTTYEYNGEKRWFPVLDRDRCTSCGLCHEFCLFGVYERGGEEGPGESVSVAQPDRCKPGCPACARLCPSGAILFPDCTTDSAIAGEPGAEIVRGDVMAARSLAKESIAAHTRSKKPVEKASSDNKAEKTSRSSDSLDNLIDELESRDM
jgi:NAD-dependent dihydropyrimidine dehydrogenase PreA subunit